MLRVATLDDMHKVQALYRDTIRTINTKHYNAEQVAAWSGRWTNITGWTENITNQHFLINENDNIITGFASLTDNGHVDMLFVHHAYQGKGIAKALVTELERVAKEKQIELLTTDASYTAKPVFEHFGFYVVNPQTLIVDGVELPNFKMQKDLFNK